LKTEIVQSNSPTDKKETQKGRNTWPKKIGGSWRILFDNEQRKIPVLMDARVDWNQWPEPGAHYFDL